MNTLKTLIELLISFGLNATAIREIINDLLGRAPALAQEWTPDKVDPLVDSYFKRDDELGKHFDPPGDF